MTSVRNSRLRAKKFIPLKYCDTPIKSIKFLDMDKIVSENRLKKLGSILVNSVGGNN